MTSKDFIHVIRLVITLFLFFYCTLFFTHSCVEELSISFSLSWISATRDRPGLGTTAAGHDQEFYRIGLPVLYISSAFSKDKNQEVHQTRGPAPTGRSPGVPQDPSGYYPNSPAIRLTGTLNNMRGLFCPPPTNI